MTHRINIQKPAKCKVLIIFALILAMIVSVVAVSNVNAHSPPLTVTTQAFISVSPNPAAVNMQVNISMWLDKAPPTATDYGGDRWQNLTVTVTKPDGTREILGPFLSDALGRACTSYCPTQTGTYRFNFNFPGQVIHRVGYTGTPGIASEYENDTFLPSNVLVQLIVQHELSTPPPVASPTSQPTFTPTPQPTPTPTPKPINWCQVGVPYKAPDGLTVIVSNIQTLERDGSYKYLLNYTLKNENWDKVATEGTFTIRSLTDSRSDHQRGMFVSMYPGDEFVKSYQFIEGSSSTYDVLEYHPSNFYSTDYLSWKIENKSDDSVTLSKPNLDFSCHSSTSYSNFRVDITGTLTYDGMALSDAPVLLSYSVNGGTSWTDLTRAITDGEGDFSVAWLPSVTGNNLLKATWAGNAIYAQTDTIVNFAVTPFEEQNVFSVTSNSTISELAFNSTNRALSFSVSGQSDTTGYVDVNIPKSLINDVSSLTVYLDHTPLAYSTRNQVDSWLISFQYHHSSHQITVNLGSTPTSTYNNDDFGQLTTTLIGTTIAITTVAIALFVVKKQRDKKPAEKKL